MVDPFTGGKAYRCEVSCGAKPLPGLLGLSHTTCSLVVLMASASALDSPAAGAVIRGRQGSGEDKGNRDFSRPFNRWERGA